MGERLSAIIVDDEYKARVILNTLVSEYCPEIEIVNSFSSGQKALAYLLNNPVNLIFLDIQMPEMTGFELLRNLNRNQQKVVIVSAHDDHGIEAVKAGAFDYLLKPLSISDLRELVRRLQEWNLTQAELTKGHEDADSNRISLPHRYGTKIIDPRQILLIESDNSYSEISLVNDKKLVVTRSIKEFDELLSNRYFFRIHNKYIVNLTCIESFSLEEGGIVILKNGISLPVSRRRLKTFREALRQKFNNPDE
mgnify:CR=1 FL=1